VIREKDPDGYRDLQARVSTLERQVSLLIERNGPVPSISHERLDNWYAKISETVTHASGLHGIEDIIKSAPPGSIMLDIGANLGAFTDYMEKTCNGCVIYAFEPVKEYANYMLDHHKSKNIHIFSYGLGDAASLVKLWMDEKNLGWNTLVNEKKDPKMYETEISIFPFDLFVEIHKVDLSKLYFIKIDVEGSEYRVLKGMKKVIETMQKKPYLFIEIGWGDKHPQWGEEKAEFEWLFSHGYKRKDLTEVHGTEDHLFIPS
jgi:FkbM family methyltransferase